MRRPVRGWCTAVTLALVATAGAACGSATPSSSATTSTASDTTTTIVRAPALRAMLLTAADLPVGWTPAGSGGGTAKLTGCSFQKLVQGVLARATGSFAAPGGLPEWYEELEDVTAGVAQGALTHAIATLDGCHSVQLPESNGATTVLTIAPLSVPTVGNQSGAWTLTGQIQGVSLTFYVMLARFDSIGGTFLYGVQGAGGQAEFLALAEKAGSRVESMEASAANGGTGGTGFTGGTGITGVTGPTGAAGIS